MNFILLTISFTVAVLLASTIATVVMYKLVLSTKFMKWFTKKYVDVMKEVIEEVEDLI